MITTSKLSSLRKDESLVLSEPQYPVCVRAHLATLEPLIPSKAMLLED